MANTITVDIQTPSNELLEDSHIPDDYEIKEMIDELVDLLELPRFDADGAPIEYSLFSIRADSYLLPSAIVGSALRDGDAVRLEAKSNGRNVPLLQDQKSVLPPTVSDNPNEIPVVLSVLDLNRTEQITLSTSRPVGELIRQIVGNYNLPPRDKLGQINKYKLKSKALGSFLLETVTLGQAGVPMLDRLTLHRDEIAGAP
ncbi:MAG: hypothetical protein WCD76_11000 [Pyrinomonadaceae bacterium]